MTERRRLKKKEPATMGRPLTRPDEGERRPYKVRLSDAMSAQVDLCATDLKLGSKSNAFDFLARLYSEARVRILSRAHGTVDEALSTVRMAFAPSGGSGPTDDLSEALSAQMDYADEQKARAEHAEAMLAMAEALLAEVVVSESVESEDEDGELIPAEDTLEVPMDWHDRRNLFKYRGATAPVI